MYLVDASVIITLHPSPRLLLHHTSSFTTFHPSYIPKTHILPNNFDTSYHPTQEDTTRPDLSAHAHISFDTPSNPRQEDIIRQEDLPDARVSPPTNQPTHTQIPSLAPWCQKRKAFQDDDINGRVLVPDPIVRLL
ncbi:unnamed protein product [Clonostachys solani]|uniref:Uncharacterized protein n=1 Tax=Clonostachys solani TaxID=160281 RepID=A0A9N9ZGS1_9HYPO|nr:unnamed protein product [Clonostachys solani]